MLGQQGRDVTKQFVSGNGRVTDDVGDEVPGSLGRFAVDHQRLLDT